MNPFQDFAARASKPAVMIDDHILTYGDLNRKSQALAAALRRNGLGDGDTVAILAPNCPEFCCGQSRVGSDYGNAAILCNPALGVSRSMK